MSLRLGPRRALLRSPAVDDAPADPIGLLVAQGDSITDISTGYVDPSMPSLDPLLNWSNIAVGGTRMSDWYPLLATTIALFDSVPDTEPKILTLMEGNSLSDGNWDGYTPIGNLERFVDAIRRSSNNIKVLAVTTLPRDSGAGFESERSAVNTFWRNNVGILIDGVADMAALPDDMDVYPTGAANTDFYPDNIHPTELVYAEMRPIFIAAVDAMTAAFLGDVTGPTIARLNPLDGATTVLPTVAKFTLRFNEHVKFTADVLIELYNDADVLIESWTEADIGSGIDIFGVDLEITPTSDLPDDDGYYINISSGSIEDISGNAFAGIADKTTWNFSVPFSPDMTASLISYWEMEEASGTRADSHGSNDLTDNNTVTQNTGKKGNAAEFTGANNEYLSLADNDSISYSGDFSCAFWFYWSSGANPRLIGKFGGFADAEWEARIQFTSTNILRFATYNSGGTTFNLDGAAVGGSTWTLGILTYTAATRTMTVSVNAGTRATRTITGDIGNEPGAFAIGSAHGDSDLTGRMDEVGFWKRALSEAEEAWLYNAGAGRTYAEIAATAP